MQLSNHSYMQQSILAAYCRTGEYQPLTEVNEKHVHQYRRLIYNIIDDSISSAYPLTSNLLSSDEWNKLIKDFFSGHSCISPQVWNMPEELIAFVENRNYYLIEKYPLLLELLRFEWLEVEVYMMEDELIPACNQHGDFQKDELLLNPEIRVSGFEYPVHLRNASEIGESDKGQYYTSLHREPDTGKVIFTDLGMPHVQLIDSLYNGRTNYQQMLEIFYRYASENEAKMALDHFIKASLKSKLLLGFLINN
jgi:uncharacterized protein